MTIRSQLLTVLMTVRNGEPYVKAAVDSVLCQTFTDFGFVIIDNASTDGSRDIINSFGDARIQLVELNADIGQTAALERGLEMIDTAFVARIDADDLALPTRFEEQIDFLKRNPEVCLLGAWSDVIGHDDSVVERFRPPTGSDRIMKGMLFENPFVHSSVVFNTKAAKQCGGYDVRFSHAQDYALWWRIAVKSPVAILPKVLTQVRRHAGQASRVSDKRQAEEAVEFVDSLVRMDDFPSSLGKMREFARDYSVSRMVALRGTYAERLLSAVRLVLNLRRSPSALCEPIALKYLGSILLRCMGIRLMNNGRGT